MRIVIVGPRDRREKSYRKLVHELIDMCIEKYPKFLIITKACDQGVGKLIRIKCKGPELNGTPEFDMMEFSVRHHLTQELSKLEFQSNFDSLNAALAEIGDEFHLIMDEGPRGSVYDLLRRVIAADMPYAIYHPKDLNHGPKETKRHG